MLIRGNRLLAVGILISLASAEGGASGRFRVGHSKVPGRVISVLAADLDGDGAQDLIAVYKTGFPPKQNRFIGIFWNDSDSFADSPNLIIPVEDEDACAFDVANLDNAASEQLILLGPGRIRFHAFVNRKMSEMSPPLQVPTLCEVPVSGDLPRVRLAQSVMNPPVADLIVPGIEATRVYRRTESGYGLVGKMNMPAEATSFSLRWAGPSGRTTGLVQAPQLNYFFPMVHVADANGDGLRDIILSREDRISIFHHKGDGFSEKPDYSRDFSVRTAEELQESFVTASLLVRDIDLDGIADVVVRKVVTRGISSAVSTNFVFYGAKGGGFAEKPAQIIQADGAPGVDVELVDVNGDRYPDLVVPSVNTGLWAIVRYLTSKSIKINFQVFPFSPGHRFTQYPAMQHAVTLRLNLGGRADVQAVDLFGDYNGDRRLDLAFATDDDELSFFLGTHSAKLYSSEPAEKITVRAFGKIELADFHGSGRNDVILFYPATKGHEGEIAVLFNQGPW